MRDTVKVMTTFSKNGKKMGRPEKAPAEKYVRKPVSWTPELWAELAQIPDRERSAFIRDAVQAALRRGKGKEGGA